MPAIVARFDAEGDLKSAARIRALHSVREGTVTDAKLTVSGGALVVNMVLWFICVVLEGTVCSDGRDHGVWR